MIRDYEENWHRYSKHLLGKWEAIGSPGYDPELVTGEAAKQHAYHQWAMSDPLYAEFKALEIEIQKLDSKCLDLARRAGVA
jgi:hypothetical protein